MVGLRWVRSGKRESIGMVSLCDRGIGGVGKGCDGAWEIASRWVSAGEGGG